MWLDAVRRWWPRGPGEAWIVGCGVWADVATSGGIGGPWLPRANGGNCSIRGATRRRHAVAVRLMVQNPP